MVGRCGRICGRQRRIIILTQVEFLCRNSIYDGRSQFRWPAELSNYRKCMPISCKDALRPVKQTLDALEYL